MGVAAGKLAGYDLSCKTASSDRGGSVVLKDAGVVHMVLAPVQGAKFNILGKTLKYNKLPSPPLLPCWDMMGRGGAESISGAGLQSHPKATKGSSKIQQHDMLSIRDQIQEKMLERVREELGDFLKEKDAWCRNERISANKLSHT